MSPKATSAWATAAVKCCEMTRRRLATVITFNSCIAVASLAAWGTWRFCLALLLRRGRLGVAPVDASDAGLGGTFACLVRTSRWQRAAMQHLIEGIEALEAEAKSKKAD
eukprot:g12284.t1